MSLELKLAVYSWGGRPQASWGSPRRYPCCSDMLVQNMSLARQLPLTDKVGASHPAHHDAVKKNEEGWRYQFTYPGLTTRQPQNPYTTAPEAGIIFSLAYRTARETSSVRMKYHERMFCVSVPWWVVQFEKTLKPLLGKNLIGRSLFLEATLFQSLQGKAIATEVELK